MNEISFFISFSAMPFTPNRLVYKGENFSADVDRVGRTGGASLLAGLGEESEKEKKEAPPKKKESPAPSKFEKKAPKESDEGERSTKKNLKNAAKKTPGSLFEKGEKKRIREAIEKLERGSLKEYYDAHKPKAYDGKWIRWNMDFIKDTVKLEKPNHRLARKYAHVFQSG